MRKINLVEYNLGMKHIRRFLKENDFYADFYKVTLESFMFSRHKHFDSVKHRMTYRDAYELFLMFFSFTATLGDNYKDYNNGDWTIFIDRMSNGWRQYCEDNNLEEEFKKIKQRIERRRKRPSPIRKSRTA